MFNLAYDEIYDSSKGSYRQQNATVITTPDGRSLEAHKKYLDKIFRDTGYINTGAVRIVYSLVGDEEGKLTPIVLEGVIVASDSDEFIYLRSKEAFINFKNIISSINSNKGFFLDGDSHDLTSFSMGVRGSNRDLVIEFDLISERVWVYQGKLSKDSIIHPTVLLSERLDTQDVWDSVKEILDSEEVYEGIPPKFGDDITLAELRELLNNCGIISYEKKGKKYAPCKGFDKYPQVLEYIGYLSKISYGKTFYTKFGSSLPVIEFLDQAYEDKMKDAMTFGADAEDAPMSVKKFLWNYNSWKTID